MSATGSLIILENKILNLKLKIMKKTTIPFWGLLFSIVFFACRKNESSTETSPISPTLQKSSIGTVAIGSPIVYTLASPPASTVDWSVTPSTNANMVVSGNSATFKFSAAGSFVVNARSGNYSFSDSVCVKDSTNNGEGGNGGGYDSLLAFSNGEIIKIYASKIIDSTGGSNGGLVFNAKTNNSYACSYTSISKVDTFRTFDYRIGFKGVFKPGGCYTGTTNPMSIHYLKPIANGLNTLVISFNGKTYSGIIVKNGNNYTINWNYTTGVIISPTTL